MEREKVIEFVKRAGDIGDFYCQTILVNDRDADDWVMEFARLVEQETLERAAMVCKDKSLKMENEAALSDTQDDAISLRSSAWLISVCGNEILNLKDNHEKE